MFVCMVELGAHRLGVRLVVTECTSVFTHDHELFGVTDINQVRGVAGAAALPSPWKSCCCRGDQGQRGRREVTSFTPVRARKNVSQPAPSSTEATCWQRIS